MESSTLFTLGRIFGLSTGALFGVVGNRVTNYFRVDAGVEDAIQTSIEAVKRISKLLERKDLS
jgi:uridine phosphorylase